MYVLAAMLPEGARVVNIGAGSGTSSLAMAEMKHSLKIYTIDISEGGPLGGLENERNAFNGAGIGNLIPKQILGDSKDIGKNWQEEKLDAIFVDGDHTTPGIQGDIEAWWPHLKTGGYMAFHDYTRKDWPDVKPVVDAHIKAEKAKTIFKVDTLLLIQKV